jgi:hypothetical protein
VRLRRQLQREARLPQLPQRRRQLGLQLRVGADDEHRRQVAAAAAAAAAQRPHQLLGAQSRVARGGARGGVRRRQAGRDALAQPAALHAHARQVLVQLLLLLRRGGEEEHGPECQLGQGRAGA